MPSAQLDIPTTYRTNSPYIMPEIIAEWLKGHGIYIWHFCGSSYWGDNSYIRNNNRSLHSYIVVGIEQEDCVTFKLRFPECKIHYFE